MLWMCMSGAMSPFSFCSLCWYDGPARMAFFYLSFPSSCFFLFLFCIRSCRPKKEKYLMANETSSLHEESLNVPKPKAPTSIISKNPYHGSWMGIWVPIKCNNRWDKTHSSLRMHLHVDTLFSFPFSLIYLTIRLELHCNVRLFCLSFLEPFLPFEMFACNLRLTNENKLLKDFQVFVLFVRVSEHIKS